jgi:hypothetical protein
VTNAENTMNLVSIARAGALAFALAIPAALPALVHAESLDGRRFEGVFLERGKTSGDADILVFKDGRFRSAACDRYGYAEVAYRTLAAGDTVQFEAESESPKYGRLVWKGVVRGSKLDATATMVRAGKSPVENWVVAAEKD